MSHLLRALNRSTPGAVNDTSTFMTCEELQDSISAYVDDELTAIARQACDAHLVTCPVCRVELTETKNLARSLTALSHPAAPADLTLAISNRLQTERIVLREAARRATPARWLTPGGALDWIAPRVMPFSVGAFASVLLFVAVVSALVPTMRTLHVIAQTEMLVAASEVGGYDVTQPITAEHYAASRSHFSFNSPSLDPQGALALAASLPTQDATDEDDMMVVADVYSDGQASLAEVMTPPRDARMLSDMQAALRRTPAFVPASLDHRPPTMRVVFMVQRMNVRDTTY